jgi:hypothetical protein
MHNKSNISTFSFLSFSDEILNEKINEILVNPIIILNPPSTHCMLVHASDGRVSYKGSKIAYGYQLIAYQKFGR